MSDVPASAGRGPLFPGRLPATFSRVAPSPPAAELVAWWWLSEWALPDGEESRQEVLAHAASNLTLEPGRVRIWGPTTRRSTTVLRGSGWVVAALLRPAAVPVVLAEPARERDRSVTLDVPALSALVLPRPEASLTRTVAAAEAALVRLAGPVSEEARLANRMASVATSDTGILSVADLARALGVSPRTVHRLAARYVGLPPYAMIRRRRLQEAVVAARLNREPLAAIAARFGFTDQAHLAREARDVLGYSLAAYRAELDSQR